MSMRNYLLSLLAMILLFVIGARGAVAQGLIIIEPPAERIALPRTLPGPSYLELRSHQVTVTIRNQIATTRIEQVFYNPSGRRIEGTFLFPMPRGGQIDRFAMDVNGKMTQAELLDADKARGIYEEIVRKLADPALLEYVDQGLLRARIFPIEPNSEKTIQLEYTQLLEADGGVVQYTYPMTQRRADGRALGIVAMRIDLHSDGALSNVYSPSHDVEIKQLGVHDVAVGFESDRAQQGNFELYFSTQSTQDEPVNLTLFAYRNPQEVQPGGDTDGFFLLLASPNLVAKNATPQPKEVIFVLDTSGSMAGKKLEQAKRALRFCLANLNKNDLFDIVRFSTDVEPLFGMMRPARDKPIQQANAFLDRLKPIGGTAIHDALQKALLLPSPLAIGVPRYVVFLTDGRPTIGNTKEQAIVEMTTQAAGPTRVFCFGIGTDINTHLLDKITEGTRAVSEYVLPDEDIEVKVSRFYTKMAYPVWMNPKFTMTGSLAECKQVRGHQLYPAVLPDLFVDEQLVVLGRYRENGPATIELSGIKRGQRQTVKLAYTFLLEDTTRPFISRLWAMRRVGYLLDEIRLHGENHELRDEVVQLARAYGIVTPYTAYLIMEDEEARAVPLARRNFQDIALDSARMAEATDNFIRRQRERSGFAAVAGSVSNRALKSAHAYSVQAKAARLGGLATREHITQDNRFIRGRGFIRNGKQWIDTQVQQQAAATPVVQITFNSKSYFDLLHRYPEAAAWLSIGRNLQLVLDNTIYEVVDEL